MQVFADTHGNVVWLGERDCSAQRRHQKLIEESPAPGLPTTIRAAMGEAAVKVAEACGYVNAGTVECLYQDGEFYFLEMNTRLQVEHCVTEMVTRLDLVAEQLRVASGEPLVVHPGRHRPHRPLHRGAASTPRTRPPASSRRPARSPSSGCPAGPGVRWDGGYDEGDTVSQYYDNLIGKLVVWAPDREAARRRMLRALGEFEIAGHATTIPAHVALLAHPDFADGHPLHQVGRGRGRPGELRRRAAAPDAAAAADGPTRREPLLERTVPVEVDGKRFSVKLWLPESPAAPPAPHRSVRPGPRPGAGGSGGARRQRHDHRADAGHDREGARRRRATPSRSARRCSCSRR